MVQSNNSGKKERRGAKKKIFVVALAVSLIAILSLGSLAWFTDSDQVTNKFMIAESDDDNPDDIFSVDVYEKDPEGNEDQDGLEFPDVLPGDELPKDAHVRNTGYYDQYVRVIVTLSDAPAWKTALGDDFNDAELLNVFHGFDQTKWHNITTEVYNNGTADTKDDVVRIVMYYNNILNGSQNAPAGDVTIFTDIFVPEQLTRDNVLLFDDDGTEGFSIDIKADAVQTQNVVPPNTATGKEAYAAFQYIGWNI